MSEMISFGGGVNSVAMTIMLVNEGWHGPIVFADTGGEHPETYCYMTMFERDWLKPRGLEIVRLLPTDDWLQPRYEHRSLEQFCLDRGVIPMMASRWCSSDYKRDQMHKWNRQNGNHVSCMGMSSEEERRIRLDSRYTYPLADAGITRSACQRIIQEAGLAVPPKSSCFFCPGQRLAEWQRLWLDHSDLYERAIALEDNASAQSGANITLAWHGPSLRQMRERRWEGQTEMDLSEWLPCICTL